LREKLKLDDLDMGVYSTGLESFLDQSLTLENFWETAQKHSIEFHRRLKNNEDLHSVLGVESFFDSLIKNESFYDSDEKIDLFTISNTNVLDTHLSETINDDVIHLKEHYTAIPAMENRYSALFFNGISTVNKHLCWSMSFNEKYFSKSFISSLKLNICNIINKLICLEED
jgi:hypothetical protein